MKRMRVFLIFFGLICLLAAKIFASQPDTYGIGSRVSVMTGASNLTKADPAVTYENPSFLSHAKTIHVSFGAMTTFDFFQPIRDVVVQNESTGKSLQYGDIQTDYTNLSGVNFGLTLPIQKITLGVTGFMPYGSLASVNTFENYIPVYGFYFNRPKRFALISGVGVELFENFSLGISGNFYLKSGANTKINLNNENSTVDLAMDIKPAVSPILGANYTWDSWVFDATYHGELNYAMTLQSKADLTFMKSTDEDTGEVSFPVMSFLTQTSMFYDPQMIGVGVTRLFTNGLSLGFKLVWKNWEKYKASFSKVEFSNPEGMSTKIPDIHFKDIWVPSVGIEFPIQKLWMRTGYRFEPEHVKDQEANSNFLDTHVHVLAMGFGYSMKDFFGFFENPIDIDIHGQYHKLTKKHVEKGDSQSVGYKQGGFDIDGFVTHFGLSFSTSL